MTPSTDGWWSWIPAMPPYGIAGLTLIVLYVVQSEVRFGAKARSSTAGAQDRGTTIAVSLSSAVAVLGFAIVMRSPAHPVQPAWLRPGTLPGVPVTAWVGVGLGVVGLLLRLWAVLTLRERYTRTLLVHQDHTIERRGPFRFVRHPGYLGSLLCLNAIALSSGNLLVSVASIVATLAAYAYRIRTEEAMLIRAFGEPYEAYRREVGALLPFRAFVSAGRTTRS